MKFLVRDIREVVSSYAKGNLLDIGCGNKPYQELFSGKISGYVGCDVVQSDKHKVDVICPATDLHFSDEIFDTVFSTQVIEHVDDPFKMLAESNRVLKKGSYIILSAPFVWELHEEPYDFYRYTKYGLQAMLEKQGFEIVLIKASGGKWATVMQLHLNMIYSGFKKSGLFRKILKTLFIKLRFTSLFNRFALWLDNRFYDELLTLNYVAVAQKR